MHNWGIKFEPRDFWIGMFVDREKYPMEGGRSRKVYICPVPMIAIWFRIRY